MEVAVKMESLARDGSEQTIMLGLNPFKWIVWFLCDAHPKF
jgi:hypothetical protein